MPNQIANNVARWFRHLERSAVKCSAMFSGHTVERSTSNVKTQNCYWYDDHQATFRSRWFIADDAAITHQIHPFSDLSVSTQNSGHSHCELQTAGCNAEECTVQWFTNAGFVVILWNSETVVAMAYVAARVEARAAVGTQSIVCLTRMIVMLCYNNTQRHFRLSISPFSLLDWEA